MNKKFAPFADRMQAKGMPEIVIKAFKHYYSQLLEGHTGLIPDSEIRPLEAIPDSETIPDNLAHTGRAALSKTVFLKLNGGLGTSMGLEGAKSSLIARDDYSFLDIIARYSIKEDVFLVLMNSFATHADSENFLDKYPELRNRHSNIPLDFLQHKVPKVVRSDLSPAVWPQNPDLEWCPPGHGDIFVAIYTSGMLDLLLQAGYEYAFISNADNLGAVVDTTILGYFIENRIPYMVEVADRTESDKKGGHVARLPDGQLIIRELAQCPPEDIPSFQDITRYKYFNTNSIWLHLPSLKDLLVSNEYVLRLSLIRNAKTVDPRDATSTPVYQLETAMGSAIAVFEGSAVIRIPRTRFIPIKNTTDLLALRSDAFCLTDDFRVISNPSRKLKGLTVDLDPDYYRLIDEMESRFPHGAPSMVHCEKLHIKGDVKFGQDVILKGSVRIVNASGQQQLIEPGSVIEYNLSL